MRLLSANKESSIAIEVINVGSSMFPSREVSIQVIDTIPTGCISASFKEIWISEDAYDEFLAALDDCEQTRRGKASFGSMSPDEFELVIEATDSRGHFIMRYSLSASMRYQSHTRAIMLSGQFDLSSENFLELVADFKLFNNGPWQIS